MNHRIRLRLEDGARVIDMPREMEFSGEDVVLRRGSGKLVLGSPSQASARTAAFLSHLATLAPLGDDEGLPDIDDGHSALLRDVIL